MARRLFNRAAAISTGLLGVTVLLWISAPWFHAPEHYMQLAPHVYVGLIPFWAGGIAVFNDPETGAAADVIFEVEEGGKPHDPRIYGWEFGSDTAGFLARYFHRRTGQTWWSYMASLAWPAGLFAILPALWLWRRGKTPRTVGHALP